jgi:DNA-binding transcriptional ArsR family regulator
MRRLSKHDRDRLYALQADICRVLGHPRRLAILDLLATGEKSSGELLRELHSSKVNLSQHLSVMKRAGLIHTRQQGRESFHSLAFQEIKDACRMIRGVLSRRMQQGTELAKALLKAGA